MVEKLCAICFCFTKIFFFLTSNGIGKWNIDENLKRYVFLRYARILDESKHFDKIGFN